MVAWASLAGQLVALAARGLRSDDEVSLLVSVLLGGLIIGYVSAGVVRARTIRLVLAWIVLVLSLVTELIGLVTADDARDAVLLALALVTTVVALAGLAKFHRTEWFAWQRTKPPSHEGAPIGRLVAIAVLVGVLGGISGPVDDGVDVRFGDGGGDGRHGPKRGPWS